MHCYEDITNDFKIVGRLVPVADTVARVIAYANERWDGNYVALSDSTLAQMIEIPNRMLDGLLEVKWTCSMICDSCGRCVDLFQRIGRVKNRGASAQTAVQRPPESGDNS